MKKPLQGFFHLVAPQNSHQSGSAARRYFPLGYHRGPPGLGVFFTHKLALPPYPVRVKKGLAPVGPSGTPVGGTLFT
jgi:hypothetical protein